MSENNFCQFKTAYLLGDDFYYLTDAAADGSVFYVLKDSNLPAGWEFMGTSISGAAGFILLFDILHLPKESDMEEVKQELLRVEAELKRERGEHE